MLDRIAHFLKLTPLLIFCAALVSCHIDGDEEITLNADGSGTFKATYSVPYKAFSKEKSAKICTCIEQLGQREESITVHAATNEHGGPAYQTIHIHLSFSSAQELKAILKDKSAFLTDEERANPDGHKHKGVNKTLNALLGDMHLKVSGLNIDFRRDMDLAPLFDGVVTDDTAGLLESKEFRYTLNLPNAPQSHNAHSTSNDGKTLHWNIALGEHYKQPFVMEAALPLPIPKWASVATVAAITLLLLLPLYFMYRWVKKRK